MTSLPEVKPNLVFYFGFKQYHNLRTENFLLPSDYSKKNLKAKGKFLMQNVARVLFATHKH